MVLVIADTSLQVGFLPSPENALMTVRFLCRDDAHVHLPFIFQAMDNSLSTSSACTATYDEVCSPVAACC
jgi:hypothetical protein